LRSCVLPVWNSVRNHGVAAVLPAYVAPSIFRNKNRRRIGKAQSKRLPKIRQAQSKRLPKRTHRECLWNFSGPCLRYLAL
jgi:hypothetical protein